MQKKKILIIILTAAVIVIVGVLIVKISVSQPIGMILFYRDGCLHCAKVDEYIKANNIEEKIKFIRKDASNAKNAQLLAKQAKICKIADEDVGVPFFWDGESCIVGDQPIIDFFKQKTGAQ